MLDHERKPKLGYYALVAACAPVIVVAERPAAAYAPGEPIELDVHVVSDRRDARRRGAHDRHRSLRRRLVAPPGVGR